MKQLARTLVVGAIAVLWGSLAALAGSYTVHLENGQSFETRYPPRFGEQDVQFVTGVGNWITLPRKLVTRVTNDTSAGSYEQIIDTKTIFIGWAPNDAPDGTPDEAPVDLMTILLGHLQALDARLGQDFTIPQFVNTEDIVGGLPVPGVIFPFGVVRWDPLFEGFQGPPPGDLRALQGLPPGGLP